MRYEAFSFINDKREEISIAVSITDSYSSKPEFSIDDIYIRGFRKKNRISIRNKISDFYLYRSLEHGKEREIFMLNEYLVYVSKEQLQQALINAWEYTKPDIENINIR